MSALFVAAATLPAVAQTSPGIPAATVSPVQAGAATDASHAATAPRLDPKKEDAQAPAAPQPAPPPGGQAVPPSK
jgi:hypothetical protein